MSGIKPGVLLVNLGTPDHPTTTAVKRYLAQFLHDHRVVDMSRWLWCPILHGVILPFRSPRVAKLYQAVWTEQGSPLLVNSIAQQQALAERLSCIPVELAMNYGNPSLSSAMNKLRQQGVNQLLILPLFPQYSSSTSAAVWDAVSREFATSRHLPSVSFIRDYAEHPAYIAALAHSIDSSFAQHGKPDLLLFSYHGIPERFAKTGDDYPLRCEATTRKVVELLNLKPNEYLLTYQSRFGREPWLSPYTDKTLMTLPSKGVTSVQVICPGFAADCLETLEEIVVQNRDFFINAGGKDYRYIPALNAQTKHIDLLEQLCHEHLLHAAGG